MAPLNFTILSNLTDIIDHESQFRLINERLDKIENGENYYWVFYFFVGLALLICGGIIAHYTFRYNQIWDSRRQQNLVKEPQPRQAEEFRNAMVPERR